ncbi:MAG: hypothetical protein E6176_09310 [Clostridium celatum]|uniref:hypothetical protein n=1 Tax=Clostridium sp. TaxID=1506 RepID=UPI0025EF00C5|nr:hypothetical protein [uncultured Clostridium sp.]MDU4884087.1 hypothetical protein [Clostridium celatum]MDU5262613.1 hypothetical protein [Clostridium celatum]MDU7077917.1 hypothetical protein [Clostridium celatum]
MDNNKILNDDNLNELGFIKKIDTYAIVDKEFDKKREWKKVWMVIGVSIFIIVTSILSIMISKVFNGKIIISKEFLDKILLKGIITYYILFVWGLMLLIVPIIKRRKVRIN